MTAREEWVYIFDLDNTLVSANSYHQLLRRLLVPMGGTQPGPGFSTCLRAWCLTALRLLGVIDRRNYKRKLQRALMSSPNSAFISHFVNRLHAQLRPEMHAILAKARSRGAPLVLGTGALAEYAVPFAAQLQFDIAVCTRLPQDGEWVEMIREAKADHVLAAIDRAGLGHRSRVFFADHGDDAALAEHCDVRFWVGADADRHLARRDPTRDRPIEAFDDWFRETDEYRPCAEREAR
jgi:phosphoserine phosphatase